MTKCKAITAIEGNIKQIKQFYEDLIILNNSIGFEYDEDFQTLLDETERLRSKFSALEGKASDAVRLLNLLKNILPIPRLQRFTHVSSIIYMD